MHVLESQVHGCEDSTVETEPRVHLPISLAILKGSRLVEKPSPEEHHLWMSPASACMCTRMYTCPTYKVPLGQSFLQRVPCLLFLGNPASLTLPPFSTSAPHLPHMCTLWKTVLLPGPMPQMICQTSLLNGIANQENSRRKKTPAPPHLLFVTSR